MTKGVLFLSIMVLGMLQPGCVTLGEEPYYDEPEDQQIEADERFEVVVYERVDFGGRRGSWTLQPGMRQKLVDFVGWSLNDRISSIRIGYMVGVAMFKHRDFGGPAKIYYGTQSRLDFQDDDEFSSLIIFHKDVGEPLGAWLGGTAMSESDVRNWNLPEDTWFYPLPEEAYQDVAEYRGVGEANDKAYWAMVSPVTNNRAGVGVQATLFEHEKMGGNSITLPGFRSNDYFFDLKVLNFEGRVSSLVVRERGGVGGFRPR